VLLLLTIECNSVCNHGHQRQVPAEEELDGRSVRAQDFRVERTGLQLRGIHPTKCHRLVSNKFSECWSKVVVLT
jgi:hypothetical protein